MILSTCLSDKIFITLQQLSNEMQNSRAFVKPHFVRSIVRCVMRIDHVTSAGIAFPTYCLGFRLQHKSVGVVE
jgi:hypothetical protein